MLLIISVVRFLNDLLRLRSRCRVSGVDSGVDPGVLFYFSIISRGGHVEFLPENFLTIFSSQMLF